MDGEVILMKYFSFREYAIGDLNRRGKLDKSKTVMNMSFKKENRFKELWVGMYMYKTNAPTENSAAFGNFNLEIDDEDFISLRLKMLTITDYLFHTYKIKPEHMNFQLTNRSLWLSIPSKVFGCFGKSYLHKIHKKMAEEIQQHLSSTGFAKGIDLAIYRWNGLMRSLGSYLPKVKRWVTKFSLSDLEDSFSFEQLSRSKFDNGYTFSDFNEVPTAASWFKKAESAMWKEFKNESKSVKKKTFTHAGMEEFISKGEIPFNRNLHIYSTALYLKGKGLSEEETIEQIHHSFKDTYVQKRESIRTIQSAFRGNKNFSPKSAQGYLDEDIFQYEEAHMEQRSTFIVPRLFIETLHKLKSHYKAYKLLFQILHMYQIHKKPFTYDLSGDKYKKDTLGYFEKLQVAGFIRYAKEGNILTASICHQPREVYKSHIVVPASFVDRKVFKKMKREFILLIELWKSGLKVSENKSHYYVNIKMNTLQKRLRMTLKTLYRYFNMLKINHLYFNKSVRPNASKKEHKQEIAKRVKKKKPNRIIQMLQIPSKLSELKFEIAPTCLDIPFFSSIIKCNYST